jgi:hypothetical protein
LFEKQSLDCHPFAHSFCIVRDPPRLISGFSQLLVQPACNVSDKGSLKNAGLRIFNMGRLEHFLPEMSSLYYVA